ncbi:MAG TPA: NUDIX hydrolase [Fibrobacteria bacterium]|nr:NUDIX hydrolase [Fibrobacteria bacterium]HOX51309.1 NUDIX hydrolase [Fibrobacteria bacterium]
MDTVAWQGRWLEVVNRDGWEFVRRRRATGVVGVIAATPQGELLLVRQHRRPVGVETIELPAGLVGDEGAEEDPLVAAGRELEEETGWKAGKLTFLCRAPSSAGLTSETLQLVLAEDLVRTGDGGGIPGEENIRVEAIPLTQAASWLSERIAQGSLVDAKIWAALWFLGVPRT